MSLEVPVPGPDLEAVAPAWSADDEWLQCVAVRQETHDVRSFVLRPIEPRSLRYRAGQFITLALDVGGQRLHRCYTLSSSPTRPDAVSITVKRVPGGPVSNWLHEHLRPGMRLSVTGPSGQFCLPAGPLAPAPRGQLYLSAGSGITPLMSMARTWADAGLDVDLHFLHAARTPQDRIFGAELDWLARQLPRWRSTLLVEAPGSTADYAGLVGRIDLGLLQRQVPDFRERELWCCGPAPFMAAVRALLEAAGFDLAHYHEESFSFEALPAPSAAPAPAEAPAPGAAAEAGASFQVHLTQRGDRFECGSGETVLQAAQRAGVRWPFSCANGVCGTCRTRRVAGEVQMQQGGGLRPREVAQGWFLPCCSKPLTDLELER